MGEQTDSKIKEMPLQERLKYGYGRILRRLHISGGISIVAMLLLYFGGATKIFGNESGIVATFFLVVFDLMKRALPLLPAIFQWIEITNIYTYTCLGEGRTFFFGRKSKVYRDENRTIRK